MSADNDVPGGVLVLGATDVIIAGALLVLLLRKAVRTITGTGGAVVPCRPQPQPQPVRIDAIEPAFRKESDNEIEVRVTGAGFAPGITISFDDQPGRVYEVISATALRAGSPGGLTGAVTVQVRNTDGGTDARDDLFEYIPKPAITAIQPPSGPTAGQTRVVIDGTDFHAQAVVFLDNVRVQTAARTAVQLQFDTPLHAAGAVQVKVQNPAKQNSDPVTYTFIGPPRITAIAIVPPGVLNHASLARAAGGELARISGDNFDAAAVVSVDGAALDDAAIQERTGRTRIDATTPQHAAGAAVVRVTNDDGQFSEIVLTYAESPVVTAVQITAGPSSAIGTAVADVAGQETAQIDGTGFSNDAVVTIGNQQCQVTDATGAPQRLIVTTPARTAGDRAIEVVNDAGNGFRSNSDIVLTYAHPPTVNAVSITAGNAIGTDVTITAGGETARITGTNFDAAAEVFIGGQQCVVAENAQVPNQLTVTTPARGAGAHVVQVRNTNQQRSAQAVTLTYGIPPTITRIDPGYGSTAGATVVKIEGTGFVQTPAVTFGGTAAVVAFRSDTEVSATTPAHAVAESVDVEIRNPDTLRAVRQDWYSYLHPPMIVAISPSSAPAHGNLAVTIFGRHLAESTVRFGGAAMNNITVYEDHIVVRLPVRNHGLNAASTVNVTVMNEIGQAVAPNAFTWVAQPVRAAVIYPNGHDRTTFPRINPKPATIAGWLTDFHEGRTVAAEGSNAVQGFSIHHRHTPGMGGILWVELQPAPRVTRLLDHTIERGPQGDSNNYICNLIKNLPGGRWFHYQGPEQAHKTALHNLFVNDNAAAALAATPAIHTVHPPTGSVTGGQEITIYGEDLDNTTEVLIGGQSVAPNVAQPDSVTVDVPAHLAGAVDVEVRNATGNGTRLANGYTYVALAVANVQPTTVDAAGGDTVYVQGTGFRDGQLAVQIDHNAHNDWDLHGSTLIAIRVPAHAAGAVDIDVTDTGVTVSLIAQLQYQ